MKPNIFTLAVALSDRDLLARLEALAATERQATAELLGHLAALDLRPSLYLGQGYGSLFDYCTRALHLSEDAACNRTKVVRTCQEFPVVLDLVSSGALTLTAVRLLGPHLTAGNHEGVLARAAHRARADVEVLVAELAPRPDVPSSVRKLPAPIVSVTEWVAHPLLGDARVAPPSSPPLASSPQEPHLSPTATSDMEAPSSVPSPPPASARPVVQPLAPGRYRLQFTVGQETHDRLGRVQALLRREVPDGDLAALFDRALCLLEEAAKVKAGFRPNRSSKARRRAKDAPRPSSSRHQTPESSDYETCIRFETDKPPSRHIPNAVKRAVWRRDEGRCAFVASTGRRCGEPNFLEFHHIQPYALKGPATVDNISLRCRRHNAYEAEAIFGPRGPSGVREPRAVYQSRGPLEAPAAAIP